MRSFFLYTLLAVLFVIFLGSANAQQILVDGSSTVYPVTLNMAEEFKIENPQYNVDVKFSGTGGGFKKFCVGETHINDASRPIKDSERETCAANGIDFTEIRVGWDALTVVVNPQNYWASCMTVEQLNALWKPDSTAESWNDLDPTWPNIPIALYAPGVDSGTFDFFTEAINGDGGVSRTDFFPSEDDTILVQGVEGNPYAMAYFGFTYYIEERDKLSAVQVYNPKVDASDGYGNGCVPPSTANIENGTYQPLSRPLFIYVSHQAAANNPAVAEFVKFYLSENTRELIASTGYATLENSEYQSQLDSFASQF